MKNGITMFKNLFDADSVMVPLISLKDHKPQFKEGRVTAPLERSTPEAQGVGSDVILNYLKELKEEKSINMHNILILRNGKIISETAFGNSDLSVWKMTFSACKSVVSLAIGMLVDEGKLDINAPICDFFPEYANPVYKIKLHDITVKTLLTMTTGSSFNEFLCMSTNAWEQAFFKSAFSLKPGSTFNYNSLNTYMLSAIIKKVSGQTLTEYLKPRLFEPLEITNYYFEKSNSDTEKGGWGLYIIPEDFAKIGQLVLNKGLWNAKRIISEEWLNEATSIQIATPKQFGKYDYGYHFWSGRQTNSFLFNGMFGQNILGYKDSGILIVTNAGNDELFQQSKFFEITDKYFSGKFQKALPKNNVAYHSLIKFSAHLSNGNVKKTF
ncbi:MAG: serine hydrolase, partial [Clostridia bacterium]|nr:serine hydrolase [Clostridia bacterium]